MTRQTSGQMPAIADNHVVVADPVDGAGAIGDRDAWVDQRAHERVPRHVGDRDLHDVVLAEARGFEIPVPGCRDRRGLRRLTWRQQRSRR